MQLQIANPKSKIENPRRYTSRVKAWKYEPAHDHGAKPAERLRSLKRESGLVGWVLHHLWWSTVRTYFRWGQRLEVVGREHLPKHPPFVLIANHSSHLDALVLASTLSPRIRGKVFPIAAGDTFFETPVMAAFAAGAMNALPMWRKNAGRHALENLRERLVGEPCAYILFPEGTRTRTGEMGRFRPGIGMMVAGTDVPVIPAYLQGTFDALPPGKRWPRRRRLRMVIGEPMRFEDAANSKEGWQHVGASLEQAVRKLAGLPPRIVETHDEAKA
jgi:1-acyl-sn-glycerol-3-phosphate acyltransferase